VYMQFCGETEAWEGRAKKLKSVTSVIMTEFH
jgi:hypothetical protein